MLTSIVTDFQTLRQRIRQRFEHTPVLYTNIHLDTKAYGYVDTHANCDGYTETNANAHTNLYANAHA